MEITHRDLLSSNSVVLVGILFVATLSPNSISTVVMMSLLFVASSMLILIGEIFEIRGRSFQFIDRKGPYIFSLAGYGFVYLGLLGMMILPG